jgi:hypothetical protein
MASEYIWNVLSEDNQVDLHSEITSKMGKKIKRQRKTNKSKINYNEQKQK